MPRDIVPVHSTLTRSHDRRLDRIERATDTKLAVVQQEVEVSTAKIDGALRVASRAAQGVAVLSQIEHQLSEIVPESTSRVAFIVDRTVLEIGDMVTDAAYRLRNLR
jgi:CHASE3 domain sensor protein